MPPVGTRGVSSFVHLNVNGSRGCGSVASIVAGNVKPHHDIMIEIEQCFEKGGIGGNGTSGSTKSVC